MIPISRTRHARTTALTDTPAMSSTRPRRAVHAATDVPHRILVIDDDEEMCRVVQDLLKRHGFAVTVCADSTRAVEVFRATPFQCVLLDLRMHGLQGTELLPILKRHAPDVPVIIVSAYCSRTDASYYTSLGATDVVAKPFNNELLLDTINRAVGATPTIPVLLTSCSLAEARDQVYRKLILTALQQAGWNQVRAARLLGVSRYSLIRWLRKLRISY